MKTGTNLEPCSSQKQIGPAQAQEEELGRHLLGLPSSWSATYGHPLGRPRQGEGEQFVWDFLPMLPYIPS